MFKGNRKRFELSGVELSRVKLVRKLSGGESKKVRVIKIQLYVHFRITEFAQEVLKSDVSAHGARLNETTRKGGFKTFMYAI